MVITLLVYTKLQWLVKTPGSRIARQLLVLRNDCSTIAT